ncbi:MAG: TIGR02206 family membrane protein, partial [Acidimicrobiales bacterium]
LVVNGTFSARTDLPLALCDAAVLVAAAACWWRIPVLVELTYFWGLAGTLQAVITPDLGVGFPRLGFFQYLVGHLGIVTGALVLVVGLRIEPRARAIPRVFLVSAGYTAAVGLVDYLTGADYMFLRMPPSNWTLLRLLGPWPWYVASAAAVALVLFTLLDMPFWRRRRRGVPSSDDRSDRDARPPRPRAGALRYVRLAAAGRAPGSRR